MSFNLDNWTKQIEVELDNWVSSMKDAGIESIYVFLSASALWTLIKGLKEGEINTNMVLGDIAGATGANLIVNQMQNWTDKKSIVSYLGENIRKSPELQSSLDRIVEKLNLADLAIKKTAPSEISWFIDTWNKEIRVLGSNLSYRAFVGGDGASAQGDGAVAIGAGGVYVAGNLFVDKFSEHRDIANHSRNPLKIYLENLYKKCQLLPLVILSDNEEIENNLSLDQIYIELDTTYKISTTDLEKLRMGETVFTRLTNHFNSGEENNDANFSAMSLQDAAAFNPRLIILGDPGGGKSTFVKKLIATQAMVLMKMSEPIFGIANDAIPLFINLQELTADLNLASLDANSSNLEEETLAHAVRDYSIRMLTRFDANSFSETLKDSFSAGKLLLVFDGLDEVPEVFRKIIRQSIISVINHYQPKHVIVTCRARAYWGELVLPNFRSFTIAKLNDERISQFTHRWYSLQAKLGSVEVNQVASRVEDLMLAIYSYNLIELASNPMFLTSILILHQRNINLSSERVYIYNLIVNILVQRWQKQKRGSKDVLLSDSLKALFDDELRLRSALELIAYESHRFEKEKQNFSGLGRGDALSLLENLDAIGDITLASDFLNYVDKKAGILIGTGGTIDRPSTYVFPHRTLQEYLAGCFIVSKRGIDRTIFSLSKEGDHWSDSIELGIEELYFNRRNVYGLLDLGYRLFELNTISRAKKPLIWSGKIATLIGKKIIEADDVIPDGGLTYLNNLVKNLLELIYGELSPHRRAQVGRILGSLGDPRTEILESIKTVFCIVEEGEFTIGSDEDSSLLYERPKTLINVPTYYISKCAITNSQYAEFINAENGYKDETNWTKAGLAWRKDKNRSTQSRKPFNLPNHPAVGITWYECFAFCNWLEKMINLQGFIEVQLSGVTKKLEGKFKLQLPNEVEWEKAARGIDQRVFPWGNTFDSDLCNAKETGLRSTTAVGLFPSNASPYGALDMCGNTWEWCQNIWGWHYEEKFDPILNDPSGDAKRVVRGGGYENNRNLLRVSCRLGNIPNFSLDDLGFRIVAHKI